MYKNIIYLFIIPLIMMSCHNHNANDADDHGHSHAVPATDQQDVVETDAASFIDTGHSHGPGDASHEDVQMTLFSQGFEIFAECGAFEKNVDLDLRAHLTRLSNYKPLKNAILSVRILDLAKKEIHRFKLDFVNQGIYTGKIHFDSDGEFYLEYLLETNKEPISFIYEAHVGHSHGAAPHGDITFLKEQAWKTKFGTMEIKPTDFSHVIQTSGELLPARGGFQAVTALSSGFVNFNNQSLDNGTYVNKNQLLFRISGQGLSKNNIDNRFATISNQYEVSKSNFLRKKTLYKESIVSARDYEAAKAKYNTDSVMYFTLLKGFSSKGLEINSPMSGNIYQLNVSNGDYVEEGEILANVVANSKLRIHADLPQKHYELVNDITSVQFRPSFSETVYTMEELNGRLISKGSYADLNAGFIPIIFEVDNNDFLAGAYAECWLLTKLIKNQLVVPRSALIEEQGNYYVFVQIQGESFEKRAIQFESADGKSVNITYGLSFGERIVHIGAMTVKVASMSTEAPVHSH